MIFFLSGNCIAKEINECLDMEGEIRGKYFFKKPLKFEEFELNMT